MLKKCSFFQKIVRFARIFEKNLFLGPFRPGGPFLGQEFWERWEKVEEIKRFPHLRFWFYLNS